MAKAIRKSALGTGLSKLMEGKKPQAPIKEIDGYILRLENDFCAPPKSRLGMIIIILLRIFIIFPGHFKRWTNLNKSYLQKTLV